jgi:hypothetical protein
MKNNIIKFQNYKHYRLPITINPLEYGKLILKIDELKLFIVQVNRTNLALIYEQDEFNHIKFFNEGNLVFEFKDHKYDNNKFIRSLNNKKFTYKNYQLTSINNLLNRIILFKLIINKLQILNSTTLLYQFIC